MTDKTYELSEIAVSAPVGEYDDQDRPFYGRVLLPGFVVTHNFAVNVLPETYESGHRWNLTHMPTGTRVLTGRDAYALADLAERLEAVADWAVTDPCYFLEHPSEAKRARNVISEWEGR
jgi:hypothetical protein